MKTSFELVAEFRETQGKGASRRLRHEGKVPAILYGGHLAARALTLSHQKLALMLENERFYSTILSLKVGDQTQAAILKDVQRHPFKNAILHIDFQRVEENEKIRISIPLHFKGAAVSPGVKSPGRHRLAHAQRGRSLVPAEGLAGVRGGRHFGTVAQREHPLVAVEGSAGGAADGPREGRFGGGGDSQLRVRKSRSRRRRRLQGRRQLGRGCGGSDGGSGRGCERRAGMRRRRPSLRRDDAKKEPAKKDAKK